MKHRIIPKLTPEAEGSDKKDDDESSKETVEQRIQRIGATKITFADFFLKCLDHDMLKLFFGLLFIFGVVCVALNLIYLVVVYLFQEKLWQFYFPSQCKHPDAHGEL